MMTTATPRTTITEVHATSEDAASAAVDLIEAMLQTGALRNLGVATGSSPGPLYREMIRRRLDLSDVTLFALDEYIGLPQGHPESYRAVLARDVAVPLGVAADRVHLPDGVDPAAYDQLIAATGGVDLQILGIGRNGHIGFNEPGSSFESRTRIVELDESTRAANARFFRSLDDVPRQSVTQGIATIMDARKIFVIVSGAAKADAVSASIDGPRTEAMPASILRDHADVTWYLDSAAASQLPLRFPEPGGDA